MNPSSNIHERTKLDNKNSLHQLTKSQIDRSICDLVSWCSEFLLSNFGTFVLSWILLDGLIVFTLHHTDHSNDDENNSQHQQYDTNNEHCTVLWLDLYKIVYVSLISKMVCNSKSPLDTLTIHLNKI